MGLWVGQSVGMIENVLPVIEIVKSVVDEATEVLIDRVSMITYKTLIAILHNPRCWKNCRSRINSHQHHQPVFLVEFDPRACLRRECG